MQINFQPVGRRIEANPGESIFEAARQAGIELISLCGGIGVCDSCKIRLAAGTLSRLTLEEQVIFSQAELAQGYRLACQAVPVGDVTIDIPMESLAAPQRLQTEGIDHSIVPKIAIRWADVRVPPASLQDLRADTTRLLEALPEGGRLTFAPPVLTDLTEIIRRQNWSARLVWQETEIIAILPEYAPLLGLAVDMGTTKLAGYLVDLQSGVVLARAGEMNPQIAYGEDVLSRISYADQHPEGRRVLQQRVVGTLNEMIESMSSQMAASPGQIVEAVLVGNTAMHHLAAGLPVSQLGESPYVAAMGEACRLPAERIGLRIAPGANAYLPPNIAGFIGADHVAMLVACQAYADARDARVTHPVIALDIGTNTEISLIFLDHATQQVRILSCSCASGPAFEGAHIRFGMRAANGAIERIQIDNSGVRLYTIGDQPPVGICGSGILDAVAEMLRNGILDRKGALRQNHPAVRPGNGRGELLLASAEASGHGSEITVGREDVNEIQLAKAAIRAGIEVLISEAGIVALDLAQAEGTSFIVAGAFGSYIHLPSAIRVGMFPDLPLERFSQIGNAAGSGARQMLISTDQRLLAEEIAHKMEYIELANHAGFNRAFWQALFF